MVLIGGLPPRSRLVFAVRMSDPKTMLDIHMGRGRNVLRRYISAEQFLGGLNAN